jgi:glycosyltransferase involved in cell wall biosynthesis
MKISIVTVTFNNYKDLKLTINSILSLASINYIQLIIVNGGSCLKTLNYLNNLKKNNNFLIINEKDKGIFHAMNKGIKKSSGDFLIFLNAGDFFIGKLSLKYMLSFMNNKNYGYYGICRVKGIFRSWNIPANIKGIPSSLRNVPVHQSMFFPRNFYKKNFFDVNFKIASDYDFKLRLFQENIVKFIPKLITQHNLGGVSSTYSVNNFRVISKELFLIDLKYNRFFYLLLNQFNLFIKFILFNMNLHFFLEKLINFRYNKKFI